MKSNKFIVLDLDETLFHCDILDPEDTPDFIFTLADVNDNNTYYSINRPYLKEFLSYLEENFEYGIFTSASADYAEKHIEFLGLNPKFVLSKDSCSPKRDIDLDKIVFYKDLSKIKKYVQSLDDVLIIDDKWIYPNHYGNLIKVEPFYGNKNDDVLLVLIKYLDKIKNIENTRKLEKRGWYENTKQIRL